ncbi:MAG: RHS repeat domain-containing protein [Blastocatellia bacterium]
MGKTVYSWGGSVENYGGTANPPGHLAGGGLGGNLTGMTRYTDVVAGTGISQSSGNDIFGNVVSAQVSCCNQKSFAMTEATYWSKPSQTTSGNPPGIYLTRGATYDFNTLTPTSATDPNSQTTSYGYDVSGNPTSVGLPTGATSSTGYNIWSEPTGSTVSYDDAGVNKTITTTASYDGWGDYVVHHIITLMWCS